MSHFWPSDKWNMLFLQQTTIVENIFIFIYIYIYIYITDNRQFNSGSFRQYIGLYSFIYFFKIVYTLTFKHFGYIYILHTS